MYRIAKAVDQHVECYFTELGTAEDFIEAIVKYEPQAAHFSGHGEPKALVFEDDDGGADFVSISQLLKRIRTRAGRLPGLFYLSSCHGNTPGDLAEGEGGSAIAAAELHREGVAHVLGYYGPVLDALATAAEESFYLALAQGKSTFD